MKQSQPRKGKAVQAKAIALQSIESGKSLVWLKLWKECNVSRAERGREPRMRCGSDSSEKGVWEFLLKCEESTLKLCSSIQ